MNLREENLAREYGNELLKQFPAINVTGIQPNPEDPDAIWVKIIYPQDEEQQFRIRSFAGQLTGQYLDNHQTLITPISAVAPETASNNS